MYIHKRIVTDNLNEFLKEMSDLYLGFQIVSICESSINVFDIIYTYSYLRDHSSYFEED